jgi:hypothetical protein
LDGYVALGLVEAVAAGLVEGSETLSVKASDVVLATQRVVLEDLQSVSEHLSFAMRNKYLVCGTSSSTSDDSQLCVEAL